MAKGATTRQRIVDAALERASLDGLAGMTIGDLAAVVGMSKSGLFAHFGSKEALELGVVEEMTSRFTRVVWEPAADKATGKGRLDALFERWLDWVDGHHLPGGCPIIAATAELDDRPGPARDHLVFSQTAWLQVVERTVRDAGGHTGDQFAFELTGIVMTYSTASRLLKDDAARARAAAAYDALCRRFLPRTRRRAPPQT